MFIGAIDQKSVNNYYSTSHYCCCARDDGLCAVTTDRAQALLLIVLGFMLYSLLLFCGIIFAVRLMHICRAIGLVMFALALDTLTQCRWDEIDALRSDTEREREGEDEINKK